MNRLIAVVALLSCVACVYSGEPSLGSCNVPTDCTRTDGGALLGATCNEGRCSYSCKNVCDAAEPCSAQASNSEAPVNFTVVAVDLNGGATPEGAVGTGQLRIDGVGPKVNGVTVNGGVAVGPTGQQIKWFAQSQSTAVDVQVSIQDSGSGVNQ